jgi:flagellar protein FliS
MQKLALAEYRDTEVMTATPQKLQLMVIEIALRSAIQTRSLWEVQHYNYALEPMLRSQAAVNTILAHLNYDEKSPLVTKIAGIYLFIYKTLITANVKRDRAKLNDAIRVLEIERETWRQVCEQQSEAGPRETKSAVPAPMSPQMLSPQVLSRSSDLASNSSFSFEA